MCEKLLYVSFMNLINSNIQQQNKNIIKANNGSNMYTNSAINKTNNIIVNNNHKRANINKR